MPPDFYEVVDVSTWLVTGEEFAGRDEKRWLRDPATGSIWLFKPVIRHGDFEQGENWSEKIAREIAIALGVPCARVELAVCDGVQGCISLNLRRSKWEMQPGSTVLSDLDPGYRSQATGRAGHSVGKIRRALESHIAPPDSSVPEEFGAFDAFVGYLAFDALIANRDRHDENWSVLRPPHGQGPDRLAGSYDHASSLGFNLRDPERTRRLAEGSVEDWTRKGTAWRFEHPPDGQPGTLTALAAEALAACAPAVRAHWLDTISGLSDAEIHSIVERVPALSAPTTTFIMELLTINRRRVLSEC